MIWVKDSPGRRVPRRPRFLAALVRRDAQTDLRPRRSQRVPFLSGLQAVLGLPPHRYHTAKRIEHAKTLLAKHAFSVTDIGMRVGFAETSSFTAAFRKATGVTPSTYHQGLL
jgi:transcriptional regulator GlxA family with amidase domain